MKSILNAWQILNQPCRDVVRLMDESTERKLTRVERFAVRLHAFYCRACRRYRRQTEFLRRQFRNLAQSIETDPAVPPDAQLPPEARQRIQRMLADD